MRQYKGLGVYNPLDWLRDTVICGGRKLCCLPFCPSGEFRKFWLYPCKNIFYKYCTWCCNHIRISTGYCPSDWTPTHKQVRHIGSGVSLESWYYKYFGCMPVWWKYGGLWIETHWTWHKHSTTCHPSKVSILVSIYHALLAQVNKMNVGG